MSNRILQLGGAWELAMREKSCICDEFPTKFAQSMVLPATTAQEGLGTYNTFRADGHLSPEYIFEGEIFLRKIVEIPSDWLGLPAEIYLERTRISRLWINGRFVGTENSLCTPHIYNISAFTEKTMEIIIAVKNVDYSTSGGHLTSDDGQTNWIGILGRMELRVHDAVYLSEIRIFPCIENHSFTIRGRLVGSDTATVHLRGECTDGRDLRLPTSFKIHSADGSFTETIVLSADAPLWSEYSPHCITLTLTLSDTESCAVTFGLRAFKAEGRHFTINGKPTMLRGKHDAMLFPLTAAAPTDRPSWRSYLQTLKDWGINHVRFHTCCPPEACFAAADELGIYLEPEIEFWGTLHALDDAQCKPQEQAFLLREGLRICAFFGNHPSFCMLSLGNELWGNPERIAVLLNTLRAADSRPLYTQGSNNFQHMPVSMSQEDFWVGVRTGKGKLIRGSFATCDAPIGKMQTDAPSANWDFEQFLIADSVEDTQKTDKIHQSEIAIQYGTGVKNVKSTENRTFTFDKPFVSHEIGQYCVYPDFREIPRYTGVLKARNFEIFKERLEQSGMGMQAEDFFRCTGKFSRDCYKIEIEAAMRSPHLAGFQLLDLQDYCGQGTATVGMLNAFLENKGFLQPAEWRGFCGDLVPMARFVSYVWQSESTHHLTFCIRNNRPQLAETVLAVTLTRNGQTIFAADYPVPQSAPALLEIGAADIEIPRESVGNAELTLHCADVTNRYALTILPPPTPFDFHGNPRFSVCTTFADALPLLQAGKRVLLLPQTVCKSIHGFYCADFWNYHMFRIISENMGKAAPVGTMGLCIQTAHPVAKALFSTDYSTPQWYEIISHADCAMLDDAPAGYRPAVQMIDNTERNHRLGILFEAQVCGGSLLVCTVRFHENPHDIAVNRLAHALIGYAASDDFSPKTALSAEMLAALF